MIEFEQEPTAVTPAKEPQCGVSIKVIGVGGAGGNTVNSIIESGYRATEFIVANADAQALEISKAKTKVQIGVKSTKGLGTGANPEIGKRAAEEDLEKILDTIGDADIVFLAGGMGGGTGSGGLPVIANALRDRGILSIAVVTKPFQFEGKRRMRVAHEAIEKLAQAVDTLIVIPNQKLLDVVDENVSMIDAFSMINEVLSQSIRGISDIIAKPGHINVDFADVRAIMKDCGLAVMGTGKASGIDRAKEAALKAISSPLLENMSVEGARGVLLNITGGQNLSLHEISQAASVIYDQAHEDANIILGSVIDDSLDEEVVVTIIATGFELCVVSENVRRLEQAKAQEAVPFSQLTPPPAPPVETTMAAPEAEEVMEAAPVEEPVEQSEEALQADPSSIYASSTNSTKSDATVEKDMAKPEAKDSYAGLSSLSATSGLGQQAQAVAKEVAPEDSEAMEAAPPSEPETTSSEPGQPEEAGASCPLVDPNDLDVPAYLRQQIEKEQMGSN